MRIHLLACLHRARRAPRRRTLFQALLCAALLPSLLPSLLASTPAYAAAGATGLNHLTQNHVLERSEGSKLKTQNSKGVPLFPFVYAAVSTTTAYDIMLSDGVSKDRRIAQIKVDGIYFGDISTRLSTDATHAAFRVTGDHLGGSSIHVVDVKTGKHGQVAASKNGSEGIGAYAWSPAGNTMAFVRFAPARDLADADGAYGTIYIFSVGFEAVKLKTSNGDDRLLGFSGDGLGVYVSRREQVGNTTLEHLVYLPISGEEGMVLLRSQPGLRYSKYTVWAPSGANPRVAYLAEGDYSLAPKNVNINPLAPLVAPTVQPASRVPAGGALSGPRSLGIVVSDLFGILPTLLRRDAEAYPYMAWTSNGKGLMLGGGKSGASWALDMNGNQRPLGTPLRDLRVATWSADEALVVLADAPTSRLVTLDYASGKVAATRYVGATPKASAPVKKLAVPYIHQVNDTVAQSADGNWACGPTSIVMTLAYYGKLDPWPEYVAQAQVAAVTPGPNPPAASPPPAPAARRTPTAADFAPYVTSEYSHNGRTYNKTALDPRGRPQAGLYGTICPTGLASWQMMTSVLQWHGLNSQYVGATWDGIVGALKRGHPVILGTELTPAGHILLAIGYTADGNLIVNDPYGNKFAPGYGTNDGRGIYYAWKRVTPRRALEVIGVYPPPTRTPTATATPTWTLTPTITPTSPPTHTPTDTPTPTHTPTPTPTFTFTSTPPPPADTAVPTDTPEAATDQ